jgi:hypothetical protein
VDVLTNAGYLRGVLCARKVESLASLKNIDNKTTPCEEVIPSETEHSR